MKVSYLGCIFIMLLVQLEFTSPILFTSAPNALTEATQTSLGVFIVIGVTAFYITGIVVLIMTVSFSSKEAKKEFLGLNDEPEGRFARSVAPNMDYVIDLALLLDTNSCMERLLCEVETEPQLKRTEEQNMLLSIFKHPAHNQTNGFRSQNRKNLEIAKQIGMQAGKLETCEQKYNLCPFSSDHIFDLWKFALYFRRTFID